MRYAALYRLDSEPWIRTSERTAHRRGACVVAVFAKDIAVTKSTRAAEAGRSKGYPLTFTTEPEE